MNLGDMVVFKNPPRDNLNGMEFMVVKVFDNRVALEGHYPDDGVPCHISATVDEIKFVRKGKYQPEPEIELQPEPFKAPAKRGRPSKTTAISSAPKATVTSKPKGRKRKLPRGAID